jgi:hypothetical protein
MRDANSSSTNDSAAVRDVVQTAYCNGAYNALDTESMRKGFHPDFAILYADGERMARYPIDTWIAAIEQRRNAPEFDPASAHRACEIIAVDVTGDAAYVKMRVLKQDVLLYTDHLFLLRLGSDWKIVSKIYQDHG